MCYRDQKPGIKDFFTNLKIPMPLGKKISLLLRNNAIKIIKRQNCCGHPDEPGC
jgi:hypothetical protein